MLDFHISTLQLLNCTNLEDELNRYYNGGGVVYVLKSELSRSSLQYTKFGSFALRNFSLNFWNLRRRGGIYLLNKQYTSRDIFILEKQWTLRYVVIYKEPDTMLYILISKKQYIFLYVLIYIIDRVVLIPKYKRTYDQSDQIEK